MTLQIARRACAAFCLLSLLVCGATAVLWVRSSAGRGDEKGDVARFHTPRGRYVFSSRRGRVVLYGPPPTQGVKGKSAWALAATMNNDHITWRRIAGVD